MTTGYWMTGPWNNGTEHIHAAKSWSGTDGKYNPDQLKQLKWNAYEMAHAKFHSSNPNKIRYIDKTTQTLEERDNHDFYNIYGPLGGAGWIYQQFPQSLFDERWTAQLELAVLAKLLARVKEHELDLGVALAEVDKLSVTVVDTIKNLTYMASDLSKGRFAQAARRFGASPPRKERVRKLRILDLPARFLEMRYAWEPAIGDAFEAATAFEAISNGPRVKTFKAFKKTQDDRVVLTNYDCPMVIHTEVLRGYHFEMYEEMGFARQLGLANPAGIIWERIPWSFVFDWFMPIGSYLNLIGQIPFMKGRWMKTSIIRQTCRGVAVMPETSYVSPYPPYPDCDSNRFNLLRETNFTVPPSVPFPNFKVHGAVHGKRVMNAVALATQIVGKLITGKDVDLPRLRW